MRKSGSDGFCGKAGYAVKNALYAASARCGHSWSVRDATSTRAGSSDVLLYRIVNATPCAVAWT